MSVINDREVPVIPESPTLIPGEQLYVYVPEQASREEFDEKFNELKQDITNLNSDKVSVKPNGVDLLLNENNKLNLKYIPDSILGQLVYGGTASMNDYGTESGRYFAANLTSDAQEKLSTSDTVRNIYSSTDAGEYEGLYFIVTSGRNNTLTIFNKIFTPGDWLVATQNGWQKVDNTDSVTSVAGKTGAVVIEENDVVGLNETIAGLRDNISQTEETLQSSLETKLPVSPNGTDRLITSNNKLNTKYIPDSVLGQLVFGGLARPVYAAGVADEYINFKFTDDAVAKLELPQSEQTLRLQDIDLSKWKGVYFVVAKYDNASVTSTWLIKTNAYGGVISLTVGDWLLSTGTSWDKVDNTDAVQSVAGKTGAVELNITDVAGLDTELNNLNDTLSIVIFEEDEDI